MRASAEEARMMLRGATVEPTPMMMQNAVMNPYIAARNAYLERLRAARASADAECEGCNGATECIGCSQ